MENTPTTINAHERKVTTKTVAVTGDIKAKIPATRLMIPEARINLKK
jgi:hypothetical protein